MAKNQKALAAFAAKKAEIDTMLARLQALSDEHFEVSPDVVNWGHVGDLERYAELLKRITDAAAQEGEHKAHIQRRPQYGTNSPFPTRQAQARD